MTMTEATKVAHLLHPHVRHHVRPHRQQRAVVSVKEPRPEPRWQQVPPQGLTRSSKQHRTLSPATTNETSLAVAAANEAIAAILASPQQQVPLSAQQIRALTEVEPNSEQALKLDVSEVQGIASMIARLEREQMYSPPLHALDDLVGAIRAVSQTSY